MAWFRRRAPMRRRRFRRRRRVFKRRRAVRRRSGNMFCKFTKVSQVRVPTTSLSDWSLSFVPNDFSEYSSLAPNFEYIQFMTVGVKVLPEQNVSNNTTSICPTYCMLPWHRPEPSSTSVVSYQQYIASDRCKIYRQTERGRQSYVPSTLVYSEVTPGAPGEAHQIIWKPKIARAADPSKLPRIFTGIIAFQGDANAPAESTTTFNIITTAYVRCINQNLMPL
ncbi:coat protein [army ant associated cyclovirus 4 P8A-3.2_1]|uniref:Coat protein n=1 Tax=army ant associated cyclovirus 4 P8A-3.2_1 TaxID=3070164 RepID=A0AA47KVD5_9CIRC|nr:coat protein [Army ant associated cyclovirus 4]WBG01477.1 coat protein [Army ant associated cyclovirus 4]